MNVVLQNDTVRAEITDAGAELVSFKRKDTGCEYIWNGDTAIWSGHAPILFPTVCALENGETKIEGKTYKIGNHGFAKKSLFTIASSSGTAADFKLVSNADTLAMYPYPFSLTIRYTLVANKLSIAYFVENTGTAPMFFQIGTHPGFNCPLEEGLAFTDYSLEFSSTETLDAFSMNGANVLIPGVSKNVLRNGTALPLTFGLFEKGALVFKAIKSNRITLRSPKSRRSVVLSFDKFPALGLWNNKQGPYVCIEPWHGLADEVGSGGDFRSKAYLIELAPRAAYDCVHAIEIN